jgi:hypothetical protein
MVHINYSVWQKIIREGNAGEFMGNDSEPPPAQYFEVLSIPATPRHLARRGKTDRSICLSIVKISNEGNAEFHKIKQWDVKSTICSVTFDRKLSNVWIFIRQILNGEHVVPLCIRMGHQIIPEWVGMSRTNRRSFGALPDIYQSEEYDILVEELSSDGDQAVMEYKHKSNAVSISFLEGKYDFEVQPSPELSMPKSGYESYKDGDFPNICPGGDVGEILDDEMIPKKCLQEVSKLPPHMTSAGNGKWWSWLRLLDDCFLNPIFLHPITVENAEGQLEQSEAEKFIENENLPSNEEGTEISQNCE